MGIGGMFPLRALFDGIAQIHFYTCADMGRRGLLAVMKDLETRLPRRVQCQRAARSYSEVVLAALRHRAMRGPSYVAAPTCKGEGSGGRRPRQSSEIVQGESVL
jgi:hypothetical protein